MALSLTVIIALIISIILNVFLIFRKNFKTDRNRSIRTAILSGIQNVNELATVRERFQSVISFSDGIKIPWLDYNIPGTKKRFMLRYYGTIICGCDLSKAQISERDENNTVKISIPRSEILDVYADMNSFEIYDQSSGIFNSIKLEDQNREVISDLATVKENAISKGILTQSDNNAIKILNSVTSAAGVLAEISFSEKNNIHLENKNVAQELPE